MGSLIFGTSVSEGMTQIGVWARSQKNAEYLHMHVKWQRSFSNNINQQLRVKSRRITF